MVDYATVDDIAFRLGLLTLDMYLYGLSGMFTAGETITGSTSGATAVVHSYDSTNSKLKIIWSTGKFQKGETITGSTSGATAKISFAESTLIQDMIAAAQSLVDEYCQTKFGDSSNAAIDYIDPYDDQEDIWLSKSPVTAISSIEFKGTSLGNEDTDYWVYEDIGMVKVKSGKIYADDPKALKVVYTWGNATVPAGVKQGVVEMTVSMYEDYKRFVNLGGATSMGMADFNVKFVRRAVLTEDLIPMLQQYRRRRITAAV